LADHALAARGLYLIARSLTSKVRVELNVSAGGSLSNYAKCTCGPLEIRCEEHVEMLDLMK
jgi:hypothetical protein